MKRNTQVVEQSSSKLVRIKMFGQNAKVHKSTGEQRLLKVNPTKDTLTEIEAEKVTELDTRSFFLGEELSHVLVDQARVVLLHPVTAIGYVPIYRGTKSDTVIRKFSLLKNFPTRQIRKLNTKYFHN